MASTTIKFGSPIKQTGLSQKRIMAYNLKNRKKISIHNSRTAQIYNNIVNADRNSMKQYLFILGVETFQRYLSRIVKSAYYKDERKGFILYTYNSIISSLTYEERILLGLEQIQQVIPIEGLKQTYFTFYCKVNVMGGQKHIVLLNKRKDFSLIPGQRYEFNMEDESNANTQLSFSYNIYEYQDVPGLTFIGTAGQPGAKIIFDVPQDITVYKVYLYNKLDPTPDSYFIYPYVNTLLVVKLNYNAINFRLALNTTSSTSTTVKYDDEDVICLKKEMAIRSIEYKGPKYIIEDFDISYTRVTGFNLAGRYDPRTKYGVYYGSYNIFINNKNNPFTILNKGKENLIQLKGNPEFKTTKTLKGLDINNPDLDGDYDFYYGNIILEVYGNFESVTLYSYIYGINEMEDIIVFNDQCYSGSSANLTYENIFIGDNILLINQQSNFKTLQINNNPIIRFNGESSYNPNRIYGIRMPVDENGNQSSVAQFLIFEVPEDHPIAFINKDKLDANGNLLFVYFGVDTNRKQRIGPDNNIYDFYYGTIIIYVYGDFGRISVYDYYYGYAGGKGLIQFVEEGFNGTLDSIPDEVSNEQLQYNILPMNSYMNINIINQNIIFTDPSENALTVDNYLNYYDPSGIYFMSTGTFVILDVPENTPIAFLNKGVEEYFFYDGYFPFRTDDIGPDGNTYAFYHGNINIYVNGDFGRISVYVKNRGFLNGRKLLSYSDVSYNGYAVVQNSINSAYPELTINFTDEKPREFYIDVNIQTFKLPYSLSYSTFNFYGEDRTGPIDRNANNPRLLFYLGDIINFNFLYDNQENTFGIYERSLLIRSSQQITNNANINQTTIRWVPVLPLNNYYYYRSSLESDLMFGVIEIVNNGLIDIIPDLEIQNISPAYDASNVSVEISEFKMVFDEIMNVTPLSNIYLYRNPFQQLVSTINGTRVSGSGSNILSIQTGYNSFERLDFDSEYFIKIDNTLLRNIYENSLTPPYYKDQSGNIINTGEEDILFKFRTEIKHDPKLLSIEYYDSINDIFLPLESSAFINSNLEVEQYDNITKLDLFGKIKLTFSEPVQYLFETYGYPFFKFYGNTFKEGYLSPLVIDNVVTLEYNTANSISLDYGNNYILEIENSSIVDLSFIDFDIQDSSLNLFFITTVDDPRPLLQSIYPAAESTAVPVNAAFELTFNRNVYPNNTGRIIIKEQFQQSFFQVFDFTQPEDISAITGWGTSTIRFTTPTPENRENFEYFTFYTLIIEGNTISNSSEEDNREFFVGLNDEETYYFRTATSTS